ncbi:hypothetical protein H6P81_008473 [Aristolochia fimbriata]|uniref:Uncharacterized protein n=1 Tax=Aristolochia fimbriata TaxID=158543 RepID=A0AAV7EI42_ARIFI|nr:hypothetical protein H6P81_008473 [Aristolochia fimbriata]
MDPRDPDELGNTTEPEEETFALQRKRSRRVSFADITSVHVFDRDEDFETPPEQKSGAEFAESERRDGSVGFQIDSGGSDDSKGSSRREDGEAEYEEEEEEEEDGRAFFVQSMDFSSPGSATGSLTSNDEENFFGPVSTRFIRSGRLSTESADSGNQQDVTLDSTAFSLHFRNLMPSSDRFSPSQHCHTPTKLPPELDEKTPTAKSEPTIEGSLIVLTGKKLVSRSSSAGKSSIGDEFSDVSLKVTDPNRYDYGKISPELEALLAKSVSELHPSQSMNKDSPTTPSIYSGSKKNCQAFNEQSSSRALSREQLQGELLDTKTKLSGHSSCVNSSPIIKVTVPHANGVHMDQIHDESFEPALSFEENESNKEVPLSQVDLGAADKDISCSPQNKDLLLDRHLNHVQDGSEKNNYLLPSSSLPLARTPTIQIATDVQKSSASLKAGIYTPKCVVEPSCESASSMSSLRAKPRQLFQDSGVLSLSDYVASPSTKQNLYSLDKEHPTHSKDLPSAKKKFLNFEASETREIGVGSPNLSCPASAKKAYSYKDFLENIAETLKSKRTVSVTGKGVNEASDNADQNIIPVVETEANSMINTAKKLVSLEDCGGSRSVVHENSSIIHSGALCSTEQGTPPVKSSSIHHVSNMEKTGDIQALLDADSNKKPPLTLLPYSLPKQTTPEIKIGTQEIGTTNEFSHPSVKRLKGKQSTLVRKKDTPFRTLNNRFDDLHACQSLGTENLVQTTCETALFTPGTTGYPCSSALCKKSIQQSSKSFIEADQSLLLDLQQKFESSGCYQTPLDRESTNDLHSRCHERRIDPKMDLTMPGSPLQKSRPRASVDSSAMTLGMTSATLLPEEVIDHVQNPGGKDKSDMLENGSPTAFRLKGLLSPKMIGILKVHDSNSIQQSLQSCKRSFSTYNVDDSGRKVSEDRAFSELCSVDEKNSGKKRWKSLPQAKDGLVELASELSILSCSVVGKVNREELLNRWKDVCSRYSTTAEGFLPTSVASLNPRELSKLQDRLYLVEEVKKYEKIRDEIKTQRVESSGDQVQNQKAVEARWLLHKLMNEQAKHCLLKLKQDRLHKTYQQLHSALQECHALKGNFLLHQSRGTEESQTRAARLASFSVERENENQEVHHRVTTIRQKLALLDESIKRKVASLHVSCNLKGIKETDETILLVTDFVHKYTSCRNVLKYLQLWELEDVCKKDGQQSIVLNFSGLLSQRFTMNAASVSSISLLSQWNDEKIRQSFPTLNASTAFEFVFGQKDVHMKYGPNSFRRQTQITSFLLGNLVDVIKEVQQAQMEILNLVHVNFHSPHADLLQLHLSFINFSTGKKVKFILDMTDLMCAVYPSEIDPSQLQIQTCGQQQTLVSGIADVACNLEAGHCMILRFCWRVSDLVKAWRW